MAKIKGAGATCPPGKGHKIAWERDWQESGDFAAYDAAVRFLEGAGFSVGSMARDEPIGLMFGDYGIAKYRNLSRAERDELHGELRGHKRQGPIRVVIFARAPEEALAALAPAGTP